MTSTVYAVGGASVDWESGQAVVVRSLDDGVSWTEVLTLPPGTEARAVAIDPTDAKVLYVGGEDCTGTECGGFVYRTSDGGDAWDLSLVTSRTVSSLVVDHLDPEVLYAATTGPYDVFKSADGGDTWTLIRSNNPPSNEPAGYLLAIDPNVPSHVYLGGWDYIAETADGGETWSELGDLIDQGTPGLEPSALTVDSGTVTQTLYAGFRGVWAYSRPAPQPLRVYLPLVLRNH